MPMRILDQIITDNPEASELKLFQIFREAMTIEVDVVLLATLIKRVSARRRSEISS